jgi:hypothetical protein
MRLLACLAVLAALSGPVMAQTPSTAKAAGLRLLTWPGKVMPAPSQAAAQAPPAAPAPPSAPVQAAQPVRAAPQPPAPVSIYSPPPPPARPAAPQPQAPQVRALAQASAPPAAPPATVRYYSLHRAYGDAPDPIALSPQFLNDASPDLAAPPPPAPRAVTTASGQVVRQAPVDPSPSQ